MTDPSGRVAQRRAWKDTLPGHALRLEPARAADKLVAPRTDVLAGRNPALYRFVPA